MRSGAFTVGIGCLSLLCTALPSNAEVDLESVADAEVEPASFSLNLGQAADCEKPAFKVTPYGSLWGNMLYSTQRNSPGPFTLYIFSPEQQGEAAFSMDARRSRFGLNLQGPDLPLLAGMQSGGKVEIDFIGEFIDSNQSRARLRHVYWEARDDNHRILFGQTWDVISPLFPHTVNFSAGWFGGNIGFRRAQARYERSGELTDNLAWVLQGSLNEEHTPDFPTDPGVVRETSDFPLLQGRAAMTLNPQAGACAATLGMSAHYGETGFDFTSNSPPPLSLPPSDDARYDTWSYNFDVKAPLTERLSFSGEFFHGSNLSPFLGGIGQGICSCNRSAIESKGGWAELRYEWCDWLATHIGFGVDDPVDTDFLIGRTRNQYYYTNAIVELTEELSTGFEVSLWKTDYQDRREGIIEDDLLSPQEAGEAVTIDWMLKYDF